MTVLLCVFMMSSVMSLLSLMQLRLHTEKIREDALQKDLDVSSLKTVVLEYSSYYEAKVWGEMLEELEKMEEGFDRIFLQNEFSNRNTTSSEAMSTFLEVEGLQEVLGADAISMERTQVMGGKRRTYDGKEQKTIKNLYRTRLFRGGEEEIIDILVMIVIPTCDFEDEIFVIKEGETVRDVLERLPEFEWKDYISVIQLR